MDFKQARKIAAAAQPSAQVSATSKLMSAVAKARQQEFAASLLNTNSESVAEPPAIESVGDPSGVIVKAKVKTQTSGE